MAELPTDDRERIWRGTMRFWSEDREPVDLNKSDLRAALDATDVYINDNQVSYNLSLPQAARDNLTPVQKTLLFSMVALGRQDMDLLRRVLGEVD